MIPHMKPFLFSLSLSIALTATTALSLVGAGSAMAIEPPPISGSVTSDIAPDDSDKEHESERKEIESILNTIESQWNAHDIKSVMSNYAEDYVNNDGLGKKGVQKLTEDFWKTYPDASATSKTKQIRIEGNFATIDSRDTSMATTKMQGMSSKGELQSVSEGQQYMKRLGNTWKIIGDRIDFEKVRVAFGLAKHLNASFTAPEQVKAGKQFSAKLDVTLPPGLIAKGSITNQPLIFPQPTPQEQYRTLEPSTLERVMPANTDNYNELLTATVILVNPDSSVMGVAFMTRRLNVVPDQPEPKEDTSVAQESSSDKVASESSKDTKETKGSIETKESKETKAATETKESKEPAKVDAIPAKADTDAKEDKEDKEDKDSSSSK